MKKTSTQSTTNSNRPFANDLSDSIIIIDVTMEAVIIIDVTDI